MAEVTGGREGQLEHTGLRPGWTTGACATAATAAAYAALRHGEFPDPVTITLPKGQTPAFALTAHDRGDGWAQAAVTKDAGDDPDVTHCAVVRSRVRAGEPGSGVTFVGGHGVGRVTLPGLPLAVGEPAINPVPRQMMRDALRRVDEVPEGAADPDVVVEISVDQGVEMARHTWNPRIGILDGLSILGTTGVVVPYSCSAWIDSIRRGIDVSEALGLEHVAGCTGSTSERVVSELYDLPTPALLDMGDFVGAVLKYLKHHPRPRLTICGGFAKISKLANGHLDLHSGRSQVDKTHLASLAAAAGAGAHPGLVDRLLQVNTGLEALTLCQEAGVPLGNAVAHAAREVALRVVDEAPVAIEVICIDRSGTIVGKA
ncbi:cobalt-precorrin-5B (C(1))-methyltransferase [Arsenicicoccus dermatophilus]|uniref:cobalt-precorrin-5B (C(1))-methyltransferase n=1 Tax=Arsenicicoccus dermatophilus TaxID=1076331 RepID=UPI001F4D18D4|nr:cobalt-precorrin-5B (C(1))-methyltransferase [Arsenicicoccus dermatophilus]MCH8612707.1 cobalt-precorrin-5B (C(1))-methyltransferase [Arsenicicoccus dermatophilus]